MRHDLRSVKETDSPRVVINHFAFRFDECVVDDFQLRVDDRHPRQFKALLCVTLIHRRDKTSMKIKKNMIKVGGQDMQLFGNSEK